jgi:hypothetical protein
MVFPPSLYRRIAGLLYLIGQACLAERGKNPFNLGWVLIRKPLTYFCQRKLGISLKNLCGCGSSFFLPAYFCIN